MANMHRIYIKLWGVKEQDWYIGPFWMEQQDVEEIIKEWLEEWKNPNMDISDSEEETKKETKKEKGKEKIGEKKKKENTGEKRKHCRKRWHRIRDKRRRITSHLATTN